MANPISTATAAKKRGVNAAQDGEPLDFLVRADSCAEAGFVVGLAEGECLLAVGRHSDCSDCGVRAAARDGGKHHGNSPIFLKRGVHAELLRDLLPDFDGDTGPLPVGPLD